MKLRPLLFVAIALLGASLSGNAEDVKLDGNWWRSQAQPAKFHHAARFFDGQTAGFNFLELGMSADVLLKSEAPNSYNSQRSDTPRYVQITGVQLVNGLNELYSDDRNSGITLSNAVRVIVHLAAGTPQKALVKMIEEYRKPGC